MSFFKFAVFAVFVVLCCVGAQCRVEFEPEPQEKPWWRWKNYDIQESQARKELEGIESTQIEGIGWRLTNESRPLHYNLRLTTNVHENNRTFNGNVEIDLTMVQASNRICINSLRLVISQVVLTVLSTNAVIGNTYQTDVNHEMLCVNATQTLALNQQYKLNITYTGTVNAYTEGFFISSYVNPNGTTVYYGATQFQPTDARLVFPCYDEPRFRATFNISIDHHSSVHAISNMPGYSSTSGVSRLLTVFDTTPLMPTYLIAFAVSDFDHRANNISMTALGVTHRVFSPPHLVNTVDFGLETGEQVLNALGGRFGYNYTLPKMDQIGITNFGGAMENWGLVVYQQGLLFASNTSSISANQTVGRIIAHEFAHQWFGNLVTPDFWTYLWLNEGFATYYEYHGIDLVRPEWRTKDLFTVEVWHYSARYDLGQYRPMSRYVESHYEVNSQFDFISYDKAGCVVRMVINALGEDVYLDGINRYFTENANGVVTPQTLYNALQRAADASGTLATNISVADFFDSWATQSGYPVLTAYRLDNINSIIFTQQAYTGEINNSPLTWWIPFNLVTSLNPNFTSTRAEGWIPQGTRMMQYVTPTPLYSYDWIIVNKEQTGYYRVNYDDYNWRLLADSLRWGNGVQVIPPVTRAQLMDDSFILAQDGFMSFRTALDMYNYLYLERDYIPWIVADRHLDTIEWRIRGQRFVSMFQQSMVMSTSVMMTSLGYNVIANEPDVDTKLRRIIMYWNCYGNSFLCRQNALNQLNAEINGTATIHSELRTIVECFGVQAGGQEQFNYFVRRAIDTLSTAPLVPLTCSQTYSNLNPFIVDMFNSSSSLSFYQRQFFINRLISESFMGYSLVLEHCAYNMNSVLASDITGYWLFQALAREISSEYQFNMLLMVFTLASPQFNTYSLLVYAEENLRWLSTYGPILEDWVYSGGSVSGSEKLVAPISALCLALFASFKSFF